MGIILKSSLINGMVPCSKYVLASLHKLESGKDLTIDQKCILSPTKIISRAMKVCKILILRLFFSVDY